MKTLKKIGSPVNSCVCNKTKTNKNTDLCCLLYEPHSNLPFQVLFEQARQPLLRHLRTACGSATQVSKNKKNPTSRMEFFMVFFKISTQDFASDPFFSVNLRIISVNLRECFQILCLYLSPKSSCQANM